MSFVSHIKRPRAILFDHDGVLVASEALHWEAWEQLLSQLGVPYNNAEMRQFIGKTAPEIMVLLLNRYLPGWDPAKFDVTALARRKNDIYLELAKVGLRPYPGVEDGLQWCQVHGIRTAVVSNAKRRELEAALRQLNLYTYFDAIVSRDDVSVAKPDPTPYLFAAGVLGMRPEDCLAIEDSPPGLEAALLARIPTAAVATNFAEAWLASPVPGRPDLKPMWIGRETSDFFAWLRTLPA